MFRPLVLTSALAFAAPAMAQEVTAFTLDNGLQVVVIEDHRAPVVVQMLWYRTGSADEPAGSSGVAHFLEHLMFKATDTMAEGEFSRVVAENGGSDNAFTSYDYTAYYQRVAADRLGLMMQMEADRMNNLQLTEEDVETERQVILEERSSRTDSDPDSLAAEQLRAALFLNHRYGAPVIGWRHEMEELDRDDALSYYQIYYSPNNATLVVAGDVQPDEVRALAEQYYGPIPAEPHLPPRLRPEEPPSLAERRLIFDDGRVAQPYLRRVYLAPERDSGAQEQAAALTYLAQILGGSSFTSVLSTKLTFDSQVAIYTGAGYDGDTLDDGTFSLAVVPAEGVSLEDAEAAMDAALDAFLQEGIDDDQLERIRTQLLASDIYARDNVQRLAQEYGAALSIGLTVEDVQAWPDILQAVTEDDILAAARDLLRPDNSVTLWLVPEREDL